MTDTTKLTNAIRDQYAGTARSSLTNDSAGVQAVAQAFGYSVEELTSIPAQANMGLSCGNPVATAHLKEGEVVVDLGSGGGLDVFLAAKKVGPTGKAIGIDMTPDMIARAKKAAAAGINNQPITNVEFHLASIDNLPLEDNSVDVILSNCVINLAPDKNAVFREMFRVLKPGGRVAVSDIALKQTLPDDLARDINAYVGCIAGAISVADFDSGLHQAGFGNVAIVDSNSDLNAYSLVDGASACCSQAPAACCDEEPVKAKSACCSDSPEPCCEEARVKGQDACCTDSSEPCCQDDQAIDHSDAGSLNLGLAPQTSCCSTEAKEADAAPIHDNLAALMKKYNVNDYAASVKIFAIKPV